MVKVLEKNFFNRVIFLCPKCGKLAKCKPNCANTTPFSWSTAGVTCNHCGHKDEIYARWKNVR